MSGLEPAAAAQCGREGVLLGVRIWFSRHWREILLVAMSVIVTYVCLEVLYRVYQYATLPDRLFQMASVQLRANAPGQLVFDEHTGYRYAPSFEGRSGPPFNGHWKTNSHGHVSQAEYPTQKPPGEYRIAVVGDSMTANTQNNVRWTDVVERQLNASPEWREFVGGRSTRMINFGVAMMGIVQFDGMLRYHVLDFDPDLIIVNFISDDIRRRLVFQTPPPAAVSDRDKLLRLYIETNIIYQIRWFRFYPELFAGTIGRLWNMRCHLPLDDRLVWAQSLNFVYDERAEGISASAAAIRDMLAFAHAQARPILFLQQPQVDELDDAVVPEEEGLVADVQKAVPAFRFERMQPRMAALLDGKRLRDRPDLAGMTRDGIARLPDPQKLELYRWFYLPEDPHYTDYGTTLYAGRVAAYLVDRSKVGFGEGGDQRP